MSSEIEIIYDYDTNLVPDYEGDFAQANNANKGTGLKDLPVDIESALVWKDKRKKQIDKQSLHNATLMLAHHPKYKGIFRYDEFEDKIIVHRCPPWDDAAKFEVHQVDDYDHTKASCALEVEGLAPGIDKVVRAIEYAAKQQPINPPKEYFNSLEWDGRERLKNWLAYYLGAEYQDSTYIGTVGTLWLIAAVARVMKPGCKFDHMLVLEGEQDVGKSLALKTLATFGREKPKEYFNDRLTFNSLNEKDTVEQLQGVLIVEFAELSGLGLREFEEVKQWITLGADEARGAYRRTSVKRPRRFVLAGTTNDDQWLRDPTGGKRFWPVRCGRIDIEALEADKEQLWAEAAFLYKKGHKFWLERDSEIWLLAQSEQKKRMLVDIWEYQVEQFVESLDFVRPDQVLAGLGLSTGRQTRVEQMRVSNILKRLGWEQGAIRDPMSRKPMRGWVRKQQQIGVKDD